ncbi:GTP-binding protein [Apostasia shenzhenica]|uniref:GTP-binding protein n=1 Tax=Apostasia shenzhenica TaxID=1088818 RepID=A0A2I0AGW7_9ASPA|nr:GTP-binding protein [Apostasia shenzhenica]
MLRAISRLRSPLQSLSHSHLPALWSTSLKLLPTPPPPPPPPLLRTPWAAPFSSSRKRKGGGEEREESKEEEDAVPGVFIFGRDPQRPPRLFVVQPRLRPDSVLDSKLSEALNLAKSLEEHREGFFQEDFASKEVPPHTVVQNPAGRSAKAHADTYFGPGTVDNIKIHLKAIESEDLVDAVFVNAILSGIQQRNLEVAWEKPVLDRVGLIIEIFNAHAETKEAKLQSELAALMYKRSRLVRVRGPHGRLTFGMSGEAEVVSGRGRGSGGRGFISGAGETELQLQRRRIQERRNQLLAQIEEVRRTRAVQRSARRRHGGSDGRGLATVAVVGYTNAGKSTLVSALSSSDLYRDDRLFATVDPRLRSVILPSGKKALLSDTVGFISDLPVQLVEAFHATLEEVVEADLLVHVLDSSAPNIHEQRSSVLVVLRQIGVSQEKIENMIEVWNKIDLLNKNDETDAQGEILVECREENADKEESEALKEEEYTQMQEAREEEALPEAHNISASNQSSGLHLNEDASCSESSLMHEGLESDESLQIKCYSKLEPKFSARIEYEAAKSVETSAITGTGLRELLSLIDEKLNDGKTALKRSYEPFDRKWRPSYNIETSKAAEL